MTFKDLVKVEPYIISLSDLIGITHYNGTPIEDPTIEKLLYLAGMDVEKGFEITNCTHRNSKGDIVNCERFCGTERTDEVWVGIKQRR